MCAQPAAELFMNERHTVRTTSASAMVGEWSEEAAQRVLDEWRAQLRALLESHARNESGYRIAYYLSDSARLHVAELSGGSALGLARLALAAAIAGALLCVSLLVRLLVASASHCRLLPRRLLLLVPIGAPRPVPSGCACVCGLTRVLMPVPPAQVCCSAPSSA